MHQTPTLNEMHSRYVDGKITRKEFESFIFKNVIKKFSNSRLKHWEHDESADFTSWVYLRIRTAIDSYCDTGSSFETYLGTMLRWAAREYRFRAISSRVTEYTAWAVRMPEFCVHEPKTEYLPDYGEEGSESTEDAIQENPEFQKIKNPRQLLMLILKCYCYLSDDFIERVAPRVGIEKGELKLLVDKLRQARVKRDKVLHDLRENINCQYYRCIIFERKLSVTPENSCAALRMQIRLEKARRRLDAMKKRMEKLRPVATNRQVADALGLSKGTVDSALHNLKIGWKKNAEAVILN
jgi:RNA polymerase sigma factor (sigma-70 family)